jgi:hypothetical protein
VSTLNNRLASLNGDCVGLCWQGWKQMIFLLRSALHRNPNAGVMELALRCMWAQASSYMPQGEISQADPHDKPPGCIESANSPVGEACFSGEESISPSLRSLVVTPVLVVLSVLVFVSMVLSKI